MTGKDWLVDNHGQCSPYEIVAENSQLSHPYWLYRFLSDLEDTLTQISDDRSRLEAIRVLVRKLINYPAASGRGMDKVLLANLRFPLQS
jgi:hypothetical protein